MLSFRNNFKNWDTSKVTAIVLKMEHAVMPSKDVDETANSAGPDQTAPFTLVCTVCSDQFFSNLYIYKIGSQLIKNISIFHGCMVWMENLLRGSLIGITRLAEQTVQTKVKGAV